MYIPSSDKLFIYYHDQWSEKRGHDWFFPHAINHQEV